MSDAGGQSAPGQTPSIFAAAFSPVASFNQWWMGVSTPKIKVNSLFSPDDPKNDTARAAVDQPSPWRVAVSSALHAVRDANPLFSASNPVATAVGVETGKIGDQAVAMVGAGVDAVHNAGEAVASGFKWVTIIVFLGLALYVFLLAAPFLPKPRSA